MATKQAATDYLKEADALLRLYYHGAERMSESEWLAFRDRRLSAEGKTISIVAQELETGVNNGYSIEHQKQILKGIKDQFVSLFPSL